MKHLLLIFLLGITLNTFAQDRAHFNLDETLAIQGYDPVSYFSGEAKEGSEDLAVTYQGATYYFSSERNRDAFIASPENYEPQYGGWCAYAIGANGEKVSVNPETFKILDGKLYLFYNAFLTNTLKSWNKDETNLKAKADENWKGIVE